MGKVYSIEYAAACHRGLVREKNQDNFWCDGVFLECENDGFPDILTGMIDVSEQPIFAVFDGMGGEAAGEQAAWLATRAFDDAVPDRHAKEGDAFLTDVFVLMNDSVCDYAASHRINRMGATTVAVLFGEGKAISCNLGDSRIYLCRKYELTQLSEDHISSFERSGKGFLEQYLGIRADVFRIEPHFEKLEIIEGDFYLLCSDGLSDMLSMEEIGARLAEQQKPAHVVKGLLEDALAAGGSDNITIIACKAVGENE